MLLERAAGLADKINRYQQLKSAAHEAEQLRTRASQVRHAAALIGQAREAIKSFETAGIAVDFVPANAEGLVEKANTLKAIATDNPAGLADPPFNFRYDFTDRINGIAVAAAKVTAEAWRQYVAENGPGGSDEVLDALARLPQLRAGVSRIRGCREEIARLAASPPSDPKTALSRLQALVAEHRAAWAELTADDIPRTVIAFIRSCAGEGAPLTLLTEEVLEWLQSRNLLGAFRIRIG